MIKKLKPIFQSGLSGRILKVLILALLPILVFTLAGCSHKPPKNMNSSCKIFYDKSGWYKPMRKSYRKWGVPIAIQLSIIYHESRFQHDAKTPRRKLFWVIPWFRQSSAYGYAQVQDGTWKEYKRSRGRRFARRDKFKDVVDFMGWYHHQSYRRNGISKRDAYNLYLAYHEGHGGYARRTYRRKAWLRATARKVQARANRYQAQLDYCERRLRRWKLWPF